MKRWPLIPLIAILFSGCHAHAPLQPGPAKPPVAISIFENATQEPLLEKEITAAVKRGLLLEGFPLTHTPEEASYWITGQISRFEKIPLSLNLIGQAIEYRVQVGVSILLHQTDKTADAIRHEIEGVSDYRVQTDPLLNRAAQDRAIREAGGQIAEKILILFQPPSKTAPSLTEKGRP